MYSLEDAFILSHVLKFLPPKCLAKTSTTSRRWLDAVQREASCRVGGCRCTDCVSNALDEVRLASIWSNEEYMGSFKSTTHEIKTMAIEEAIQNCEIATVFGEFKRTNNAPRDLHCTCDIVDFHRRGLVWREADRKMSIYLPDVHPRPIQFAAPPYTAKVMLFGAYLVTQHIHKDSCWITCHQLQSGAIATPATATGTVATMPGTTATPAIAATMKVSPTFAQSDTCPDMVLTRRCPKSILVYEVNGRGLCRMRISSGKFFLTDCKIGEMHDYWTYRSERDYRSEGDDLVSISAESTGAMSVESLESSSVSGASVSSVSCHDMKLCDLIQEVGAYGECMNRNGRFLCWGDKLKALHRAHKFWPEGIEVPPPLKRPCWRIRQPQNEPDELRVANPRNRRRFSDAGVQRINGRRQSDVGFQRSRGRRFSDVGLRGGRLAGRRSSDYGIYPAPLPVEDAMNRERLSDIGQRLLLLNDLPEGVQSQGEHVRRLSVNIQNASEAEEFIDPRESLSSFIGDRYSLELDISEQTLIFPSEEGLVLIDMGSRRLARFIPNEDIIYGTPISCVIVRRLPNGQFDAVAVEK